MYIKSEQEQQIEKMARIFCTNRFNTCDNCLSKSICYSYRNARAVYNAGYREQGEGEWLAEVYKGDEIIRTPNIKRHQHAELFCSLCGKYALLDGVEDYVPSNYCPNCGAKMKNGGKSE